jgi:alkaline phosphatase D
MTPGRPIERRAFLGAMAASLLAACSNSANEADTGTVAEVGADTSAAETTSTVPDPGSITEAAGFEPLEAPPVDLPDGAMALGVASGEPDHESVVLWTRLLGDLPVSVGLVWEMSEQPDFANLVATGLASVDQATGHSAHVIADGLQPDRRYWYRFRAGSSTSAVGRTRTMPSDDDPRPIILGISSCQARSDGQWAAHRDLADSDVDVVAWLGDYIYGEHQTLDDYRAAYTEYRSDRLLRACHEAHPWLVFTDDHEVVNDYDAVVDPGRRAAAYQAWWEHQPTRLEAPGADGALRFHRSFRLGGTVNIVGLDVRQYADGRSLLGEEQWRSIEQAVTEPTSHTVIASPVLMSGVRDLDGAPLLPYSIDAYPDERARMARLLASVDSPLIVSGDLHTSLVADFTSDPLDPASTPIALELMAPAISSSFPERLAPLAPFLPLVNPQLRRVEVENGWLRLELTPDGLSAANHFVDDVKDPNSSITVRSVSL